MKPNKVEEIRQKIKEKIGYKASDGSWWIEGECLDDDVSVVDDILDLIQSDHQRIKDEIEKKKYVKSQGIDAEMASFNNGLQVAKEIIK